MHWIPGLCLAAVGGLMMCYAGSKPKCHGTKYEIVFAIGLIIIVVVLLAVLKNYNIVEFT